MTSLEPLAELALRALAEAEPGSYSHLDAAARHDLDYARGLSPGERIAALNEILLFAETFGLPPASREPIRHRELRL